MQKFFFVSIQLHNLFFFNLIKITWYYFYKIVTIATKMCLSARPRSFFFCVGKNLLLPVVMMKKVTNRGFLAFWPFENERKFIRKQKNSAKNLKFGKKWVLPFQALWNVRLYHHHTSYYTDHLFPIININCSSSIVVNFISF